MVRNLFNSAIQIVYAWVNNVIGSQGQSHLYFPAGKPYLTDFKPVKEPHTC
jgi:hypothetical protein